MFLNDKHRAFLFISCYLFSLMVIRAKAKVVKKEKIA